MVGEPESLFSDEPLRVRVERHNFDRLLMLSDGVFAIAITLLAIELPLPRVWDGSFSGLIEGVGRPLIGYFLAFVMVGGFWIGNRRLMAHVHRVDMPLTLLTLLLLGLVGLSPLVARLIAEQGLAKAMSVYLLTVGTILFVTAAMGIYAGVRGLLQHGVNRKAWGMRMAGTVIGGVLLIGVAAWSLVQGERITSTMMVGTAAILAITSRLLRRRSVHLSSTNRP